MGKKLHLDSLAEQEANKIGEQFMNSTDVVGDMSRAYGCDLSSVRIHTDENAAQSAAARGVDAFSTGQDVFFGKDVFNQNDPASRGLLAHELSHSMQQGIGGAAPAVEQSAPMGAEQGGLRDWFRRKFGKKKAPEISGPISVQRDTSEDAERYRKAMNPYLNKERGEWISQMATPAPRVGVGGGAGAAEAFRKALRGEEGGLNYIQRSNEGFAEDSRSTALVNLGLRTSSDAPSVAEKDMRGSIYDGLGEDYSSLVLALQNGGVDTERMLAAGKQASDMVKVDKKKDGTDREEKLAYATGAGMDELNSKAMDMFSAYVLSDASLDYIRDFSAGVGGADVFGGKMSGLNGASGYALQTLVNTVGGNTTKAVTDARLSGASRRVAVQIGRTMGSLPKMAMLPEESLPESLRPLRTRYIQLQEELDRRIAERNGN